MLDDVGVVVVIVAFDDDILVRGGFLVVVVLLVVTKVLVNMLLSPASPISPHTVVHPFSALDNSRPTAALALDMERIEVWSIYCLLVIQLPGYCRPYDNNIIFDDGDNGV